MSTSIERTSSSLGENVSQGVFAKLSWIKQSKITRLDIFLLAVTGILSGQVTAWNGATTEGFWVLMGASLFNTIGYVILTCCIAEMTSALPFSGGIYGLVRAFTLPVLGYIVAVFELTMNLFYVSPVVYNLSTLPVRSGVMPRNLTLLHSFLVYFIILVILLIGGKLFWKLNALFGVMVMIIFFIYIIGSCTYADFDEWGLGKHGNSFSETEFMKQIPLVSTLYLGIQLIPLTSRCTSEPKKDVPIVMSICMVVFAFFSFGLITTAVSQYPGIDNLTIRSTPLTYGFSRIFDLNFSTARWINYPFLFTTSFSFIFFCGRQASCMARSGLIPNIFQRVIPVLDTPYVSLLTFVCLSFCLNVVIYYDEPIIRDLYLVTSMSSFIVYIAALIGYIRFHKKYSSLERYFTSPFGIFGAYCGIAIFGCCFIGGAFFQTGSYVAIIIISITAVLGFLYFFLLSRSHVFSEEEKQELFKAYLVNGKNTSTFSLFFIDLVVNS